MVKPTEMFDDAPVSSWEPPPVLAKRYTDHVWIDPYWKRKLWGIVAGRKLAGKKCTLRSLIEEALTEMYGPVNGPDEEE